VIRWAHVLRLPQSSVAAHMRSNTLTRTPGGIGGCVGSGPRGGCGCGGGIVDIRTTHISTITRSPASRPETRNVPRIFSVSVPRLMTTELYESTLALR